MRDQGSDHGVEFVVSDADDGPDEELAQPAGFPRLRRAGLPLFVAAAVALVVLIAIDVVHGSSGSPSAAPATVTVSPTPSTTAPVSIPTMTSGGVTFALRGGFVEVLHPALGKQSSVRIEVLPSGVSCPSASSCDTLFGTPDAVRAAIRGVFPKATHLRTVTTIVHGDSPGSQLLVRRVGGRVGSARLTIGLHPASPKDRIGWNETEDAQRSVATATAHVDGRLVTVSVSGPPGHDAKLTTLRRLATDPRLGRLT